eukprot:s2250_g11.t1
MSASQSLTPDSQWNILGGSGRHLFTTGSWQQRRMEPRVANRSVDRSAHFHAGEAVTAVSYLPRIRSCLQASRSGQGEASSPSAEADTLGTASTRRRL